MVPRSLKGIIKKSDAPLSLLDCIILKKYPIYFLEFAEENESDRKKFDMAQKQGGRSRC